MGVPGGWVLSSGAEGRLERVYGEGGGGNWEETLSCKIVA